MDTKKSSSSFTRELLSKFFTLLVLGLLIWYLYDNRSVFSNLENFRWYDIVILVLWNALFILAFAVLNHLMILRIDPTIPFSDNLFLQFANNMINKLIPRGGSIYRATYLRIRYGFPYSKFLSTIAGLYIISLITQSLVGLVCLAIIYFRTGLYNFILLAAFLTILLGCLLAIYFNPTINNPSNRILRALNSVLTGWNSVKQKKSNIVFYSLFSLISMIVRSIQYLYIYRLLGSNGNFVEMLFIASVGIITSVVNITPDGLGINEAVLIFSSSLTVSSGEILVLGSLILRTIALISTLIFGSLSYFVLQRRLRFHAQEQS